MTEDVTARGFTPKTQRGYIRAIGDFTAFSGHPPGTGVYTNGP